MFTLNNIIICLKNNAEKDNSHFACLLVQCFGLEIHEKIPIY